LIENVELLFEEAMNMKCSWWRQKKHGKLDRISFQCYDKQPMNWWEMIVNVSLKNN